MHSVNQMENLYICSDGFPSPCIKRNLTLFFFLSKIVLSFEYSVLPNGSYFHLILPGLKWKHYLPDSNLDCGYESFSTIRLLMSGYLEEDALALQLKY